MAVVAKDVVRGRCFRTKNWDVRYVRQVTDGRVVFEARGRKHRKLPWDLRPVQPMAKFLSEVVEEVAEDADPNFGGGSQA